MAVLDVLSALDFVKLFFCVQSLAQLKEAYKDAWETFLSNAGLKIFFHVEDQFTREYLSTQLGDAELIRETSSVRFIPSMTEM